MLLVLKLIIIPPFCFDLTDLNTGLGLWIQQFRAVFIKRLRNSFRNWLAVIWQLILPITFILLALVLVEVSPTGESNDPKRALTLENSALTNNVTIFWAQFDNGTSTVDLSVSSKYSQWWLNFIACTVWTKNSLCTKYCGMVFTKTPHWNSLYVNSFCNFYR